ncbi:MAG TPA: hypothetical protein VMO00_09775 [Methylomirabilota bacterium]|nr:hypothetical protein [Methylomirabilota bacterium]
MAQVLADTSAVYALVDRDDAFHRKTVAVIRSLPERGYRKSFMRIYPKVVTPECFRRGSSHGSTLLTMTLSSSRMGQSFAWIPAKNMRE